MKGAEPCGYALWAMVCTADAVPWCWQTSLHLGDVADEGGARRARVWIRQRQQTRNEGAAVVAVTNASL